MVDSQLNFVSSLVSASIKLADIKIRDIGAEGGSASTANAVRVVLQELVASILNSDDLPERRSMYTINEMNCFETDVR